ncbi:unnamed protein product [Plutella xylostella]|uniref:(diamondback moth) hypothetical protein n=1 Tax=Plutella xylostella TaxID=51655 RepID=A0A8S4E6G0_PLUXY|nr:unnamed protein product [Plutella xylostella]
MAASAAGRSRSPTPRVAAAAPRAAWSASRYSSRQRGLRKFNIIFFPVRSEANENRDYSLPLGIAIFVISKAATILWNFQDMVIILVSLGLASRYGRLNKYVHHLTKMESISGPTNGSENDSCMDEYASLQAWRRVREAFVRQAALVRSHTKLYLMCRAAWTSMRRCRRGGACGRRSSARRRWCALTLNCTLCVELHGRVCVAAGVAARAGGVRPPGGAGALSH